MAKLLNTRQVYEFKEIVSPNINSIDKDFTNWIKEMFREEFNITIEEKNIERVSNAFVEAEDSFVSVICLETGTMFFYYKEWVETNDIPKFALIKRKLYFKDAFVINWKNIRELDNVEYCYQKD